MTRWLMAVAAISSVSPAVACSCPFPRNVTTAAERDAYRLGHAPIAALLRINRLHVTADADRDPEAVGDGIVVKAIKGHPEGEVRVITDGGEEGANCGLASTLFAAVSERRLLAVALFPVPDSPKTYGVSSCGYVKLEDFGSAIEDIAGSAPAGRQD